MTGKALMKLQDLTRFLAAFIMMLYCAPSAAIPTLDSGTSGSYEEIFDYIELPHNEASEFSLIWRALKAGDTDKAKKLLAPMIAKMPDNSAVWELDGTVKFNAKELDAARLSLKKALSISPELTSAMVSLGLVELAQGDLKKSQALLKSSLKSQPNNPIAHKYLARIAVHDNNLVQAEKHYLAAIQSVHGNAKLYNELATLYLGTKRYSDTEKLIWELT